MATKKTSTPAKQSKSTTTAPIAAPSSAAPQVDLSTLLAALGGQRVVSTAQIQVGIRNIGGSTLGVPAFGNEPSISLHPFSPVDPNSVAVISLPRWQQLRKSTLFDQGLIERFDEILDESAPRAPEDKPHELAPNHTKNRLPDPKNFIESRNETELRADMMAMTSENTLQRILATVDDKVRELQTQYREEGDPNPSQRAVDELPSIYGLAERLAEWRLSQLSPTREAELPPAIRK